MIKNMRARLTQIFVLLILLPAFLTIGVSEGLGFSWCFGDDGHVALEYASTNGCDSSAAEQTAEQHCDAPPGLTSDDDHCGPCLDFALEQGEAVFAKRLDKHADQNLDNQILKPRLPGLSASIRTVVSNLAPQPPPRTPQTVLLQRTTVLLI